MLIGVPTNYGHCNLPGNPCSHHRNFDDPPWTWENLRDIWINKGHRMKVRAPRWKRL